MIIEWTKVVAVFAFKRDLFAYDSISLCFSFSDQTLEIWEEMEGWEPLVRKLPDYLEGCEPFDDWFETVAQPPFETNWTQIYQRAETGGSEEPGSLNILDVEPAGNARL